MGARLGKMFLPWEAKLLVPPHSMIQRLAVAAATAAAVFFPGKETIASEVIACQEQKTRHLSYWIRVICLSICSQGTGHVFCVGKPET